MLKRVLKKVFCGFIFLIILLESNYGLAADSRMEGIFWGALARVDYKMMDMALNNGVDVNGKTQEGEIALFSAVSKNNEQLLNYLISKGADVNLKGKHWAYGNINALEYATIMSKWNIAETLVLNGADVNVMMEKQNVPLLTYAIGMVNTRGASEYVKFLLDHGANVNLPNKDGYTPLMHAANTLYFLATKPRMDLPMAEMLLRYGADSNAKRWDQQSNKYVKAVDYAIARNNPEMINILLPLTSETSEIAKSSPKPSQIHTTPGWDESEWLTLGTYKDGTVESLYKKSVSKEDNIIGCTLMRVYKNPQDKIITRFAQIKFDLGRKMYALGLVQGLDKNDKVKFRNEKNFKTWKTYVGVKDYEEIIEACKKML